MKLIPILFSTPMVQAILKGRKTQTRRIISERNSSCTSKLSELDFNDVVVDGEGTYLKVSRSIDETRHRVFPKYEVGDVLWVRETWCDYNDGYGKEHEHLKSPNPHILYKADCQVFENAKVWRPSIHMHYSACRIWLGITDIRVDRLQDISEEEAKAEGAVEMCLDDLGQTWKTYKCGFQSLWESINGAESWGQNPWVWKITFERIEKPC